MSDVDVNDLNEYPTCSTCKLCIQLNKHPWNKKVGKGNMSELLGYVCLLFINDSRPGIFMETNKSTCECHIAKTDI